MMAEVPKKLIRSFPRDISNFISQAGVQAYQMSYEFLDQYGILFTKRGKDLLPHVRNALYDLKVIELVKNSEIPFKYEEKENAAMNCYHALFIGESCKFSISHVENPGQFPRGAVFRGIYASNNMVFSLFPDDEEKIDETMSYALLTHGGAGEIMNFARIGFPCNGERKWAGHQLPIFDRKVIASVKEEPAKKIDAEKPKWKKIEERLGDILK